MECICGCVSPSVGIAYVGVRYLDQKAWKVSLLRSTRIEKSSKQTSNFYCGFIMYECVSKYLALVGIYHHWGTSSKRV